MKAVACSVRKVEAAFTTERVEARRELCFFDFGDDGGLGGFCFGDVALTCGVVKPASESDDEEDGNDEFEAGAKAAHAVVEGFEWGHLIRRIAVLAEYEKAMRARQA